MLATPALLHTNWNKLELVSFRCFANRFQLALICTELLCAALNAADWSRLVPPKETHVHFSIADPTSVLGLLDRSFVKSQLHL